jgi:hypothetical protein
MKLGVTGHQRLVNQDWVQQEIVRMIHLLSAPITGVTCLAVGADQIFAQAVLDCGGALQIIVPCGEYEKTFDPDGLLKYKRLLSQATTSEVLPLISCNEDAYFLAGKKVVDVSDLIIAVWNGEPAAGLGGTGDIVEYAQLQCKRYVHVNPVTRETVLPVKREKEADEGWMFL